MNRTKLKDYARQARRDFIEAMSDRAAFFGLTTKNVEPIVERGDVAVIAGREHPRAVAKKRKQLEHRITRNGFTQTMEALAYTWFNRFVAIRFMELHGYLEHGYRVLGHPAGKPTPEILEHAEHVELPGLKREKVIDLKLAGNQEASLYRLLLIGQCNALSAAMPFLFERIDDETELLLPDNLLHSDSIVRKLVKEVDEDDWQAVEIIGWLYQFYISEKKEEVIGKVVASEDIPAATQLFTPNWIVKYLVQNTLGRQWLATYPESTLRRQMPFYIEPAEQTHEVQEQLKAITPTSLNPEELTLLDPACGSGHILVEAYDLFKVIYQERGYRAKDIPALILQRNLFGLEVDDRAAQLATFALLMKARADDRRLFDSDIKLNVLAIQDSYGLNSTEITYALNSPMNQEDVPTEYLTHGSEETPELVSDKSTAETGYVSAGDVSSLLALFENAKTFGSLIQVPPTLAAKLPEIKKRLDDVLKRGDLTSRVAGDLLGLITQSRLLTSQYSSVVMNPPYLSSGSMNTLLKDFAASWFSTTKGDLFAMFVERAYKLAEASGFIGVMSPFTWMFIKTYEAMRYRLLKDKCLWSLVKPEYHAFFESAYVPICAFCLQNETISPHATFVDLSEFYGESLQSIKTLEAISANKCEWRFIVSTDELSIIPGSPIAFTVSPELRHTFARFDSCSRLFFSDGLTKTGNNQRYLRMWWEVSGDDAVDPNRYRTCAKGGDARRYFGNCDILVEWSDESRRHYRDDHVARITPEYLWQRMGISWTKISSKGPTFRLLMPGMIAETGGPAIFTDANEDILLYVLAFLNSPIAERLLALINPTLNVQTADVLKLPLQVDNQLFVTERAKQAIDLAMRDWNSMETSLGFARLPLLVDTVSARTVEEAWRSWQSACESTRAEMGRIERDKNSSLLASFGLTTGALSPEIPADEITLCVADCEEDMKQLLSYSVGCAMGRYSLDKTGLIYAGRGNQGFNASQYRTLRADDDGIVPVLEAERSVCDDIVNRLVEFVGVAWPEERLEENLKFIANGLGPTSDEQPRDTIRRYLATGFYKHHLSMYKKRPIYWLFSSGKQRAFQCLVYLHRYNEGTLARMRTEYVLPLQSQIASRIEQLEGDKAIAIGTSHRRKLQKEQDRLKKQRAELSDFEEKLKHAADQRICLDLDDGVRVNYAKFGDLLAESKAVTGGTDDE